jgi:hypothetical protein
MDEIRLPNSPKTPTKTPVTELLPNHPEANERLHTSLLSDSAVQKGPEGGEGAEPEPKIDFGLEDITVLTAAHSRPGVIGWAIERVARMSLSGCS